jgi:hypothetical protein
MRIIPSTRRFAVVLAIATLAGATTGCATLRKLFGPKYVTYKGQKMKIDEARKECRKDFAACAPRPSVAVSDIETTSLRKLVHVSSRLDVEDEVAEAAAQHLRAMIMRADTPTLLQIGDAIDATEATLGRCNCEGVFKSAFEQKELKAAVTSQLPPKQRSPEYWADRALERLETMRSLSRRSAELTVGGDARAAETQAEEPSRAAERELCETLHSARRILTPDAFETMLVLAHRKRVAESGEGSGEIARRVLRQHANTETCAPRR